MTTQTDSRIKKFLQAHPRKLWHKPFDLATYYVWASMVTVLGEVGIALGIMSTIAASKGVPLFAFFKDAEAIPVWQGLAFIAGSAVLTLVAMGFSMYFSAKLLKELKAKYGNEVAPKEEK